MNVASMTEMAMSQGLIAGRARAVGTLAVIAWEAMGNYVMREQPPTALMISRLHSNFILGMDKLNLHTLWLTRRISDSIIKVSGSRTSKLCFRDASRTRHYGHSIG
jgi:zinc transporter ZupT